MTSHHIAASVGGHAYEESGEEEENKHDIDLPEDEFDDEE